MNVLVELGKKRNVDIATVVRGNNKETGEVQVEAKVTVFVDDNGSQTGSKIVNQATLSALRQGFEAAQLEAIKMAAIACGLITEENV